MRPALTARTALLELVFLLALVFSYVWVWAGTFSSAKYVVYVLGLGFTIATHLIHRESPRELGLRLDNLAAGGRDAALPMVPFVLLVVSLSIVNGHWSMRALDPDRFLEMTAWGFLQQYLLQAFIHRRVACLIRRPLTCHLAVAAIFGLLHLPHPVLVPVTFVAGYLFAFLYRRHPNLFVLGLCHAIGSTAVAFGFDPAVIQRMRVGPGYFGA